MASPNPKEASRRKEILDRSSVRFLYVFHFDRLLPEGDPLLGHLSGSDLLLFEFIGTRANRTALTKELNLILSAPDVLSETDKNYRKRLILECAEQPHFLCQVALHFAGSGKRLHLVDIDDDDDAYSDYEEIMDLQLLIGKLVSEGDLPTATGLHQQVVALWAGLNAKRERIVAEQVGEIINSLLLPAKVAVIQGAVHTPTSQIFQNTSPVKSEVVSFFTDLPLEAGLWLKKGGGREISQTEYLKAFIAQYLLLPGSRELYGLDDYNLQVTAEANQIAALLTDEQAESALPLYQTLYRSRLGRLMPKNSKNFPHPKHLYAPFACKSALREFFSSLKRWTER